MFLLLLHGLEWKIRALAKCMICIFFRCRYDDVTKRLKESSDEFERAKEAAQEASEKFENIKSKRMEMFMECFNHVSDSLTTIYKDLTKSSKHPLGGNAYLSLDDSEVCREGGRKGMMPSVRAISNR